MTTIVTPSEPKAEPHPHYPGLDTLRAAAILAVIPFHAWSIFGGAFIGNTAKSIVKHGWVGVELFFVLSGFLIGSQLLKALARNGRVDFRRFYFKRSMRILPAFFAVLLLYYVWPAFREKPEIDPAWRFMLFIMNYGRDHDAYSHAWSLCVEEHFYLVFPSIVAVCAWRPKLLKPGVLIAVIMIGSALLRAYLWSAKAPFFLAVYRPSHTHLDGLTVGVALALIRQHRGDLWTNLQSRAWPLFLGGLVCIGTGLWMYGNLQALTPYALTFTVISLGVGGVLVAAMTPTFWLARWRIPGASFIATLAFTLYLTHKQMIHLATVIVGDYKANPAATIALSVGLTIAGACVIHYVIEKPFLKLRNRLLETPSFAMPPATAMPTK